MSIGENIYKYRTQKNLSQEELADILQVSRQSVSKWETDSSVPELSKLHKLCDVFEVSLDELTQRQTDKQKRSQELNELIKMYGTEEEVAEVLAEEKVNEVKENSQLHTDTVDPVSETDETNSIEEKTPAEKANKPKNKKVISAIVISVVLCACIVGGILLFPFIGENVTQLINGITNKNIDHTYVLVHGLGGWGQGTGINAIANYWGGGSDDLVAYLNEQGFKTVAPSIGPVSSTWDRTCELYAQLTGTQVDYGEVHSKEHNHDRFGRTYQQPLIDNWGDKNTKISLIGHSFGGAAVRMLTSLLEYGCEEEIKATGENTSPLFTGEKGHYVHSVVTLCAPHNGSSLATVLDKLGNIANIGSVTDLLVSLCFSAADIADSNAVYDFHLDQFGIGYSEGGEKELHSALSALITSGNDHAGYDLSPDGAAELNKKIKTVDSVYYYSYAYSTTKEDILGIHTPSLSTLPVLYPFAIAMGAFEGTTSTGILIDKTWRENDGLVNVVSAQYPFTDEYTDYNEKKIKRGIWNVMPVSKGDHGKVIGLNANTEETHNFWINMLTMVTEPKQK